MKIKSCYSEYTQSSPATLLINTRTRINHPRARIEALICREHDSIDPEHKMQIGISDNTKKLNLFIIKKQKEKKQEEEIEEAVLNQVGTRVIPQIKKYGLWREREEREKGKAGKRL